MKKIYALFMTLCLVISATAAPLVGTVKKSYPLNEKEVVSEKQLSLGLSMKKAPAATQGMQYDATEGELIRYYNESDALTIDTTYASEGQLSVRLVASDRSDMLSLVLFAESTVPGTIIPEGTYPITSEPANGTAYASPGVQNGSVYPSFYGMLNANGQILTPLYFLESGNVVVEAVNGNLKISINAANSNDVPMTIVYEVGGKSEKVEVKGPLKYDATEADGALDVTYGADATVQLTNGNGYSILTVASPDATNEVDLAIFYDAADPETVIPAGTYTIDDSYTSGTVLASTGVNNQGQVSLSFYANLNEEGYLVTPIYFLVSGTVEVTNVDGQLKVEVNAVNSNNVPIHVVYDPTPAPTTETVYFVNAQNWATVNAYAWDPVQNADWPGVAATKEAEQIGGYDVYSFTANEGQYANVIFNNGSSAQTADLVWTAGKYYVKDGWYTKEEAEAKLAAPVEYESVYFVDNQGWGKANIYTWNPEVATWPGVAMTKEAEQLAGYDVYSYTVEKGTTFGGMLFNNANGVQTGDLVWTASKYYVKDGWYTKEEAEAKLAGPVTPPVITYVLMGVAGDWTTGIEMTINPDNENEYVLLGQDIAEGDAVKVVTLTDGVATAWCGNVDEYSVAYTADDMGNIVLAPGKYDFYYKVAEDLIYIGAVEPTVEVMELTMTNLQVSNYGDATGLWASDMDNGIEVMLFLDAEGNLMEESSIMVGWMDYTVTGTVTKAYDEELATDVYTAELYTTVDETNYKLIITMYYVPVEATVVVVENATIEDQTEESGFMFMNGEWTDADGLVYPVSAEVPGFDATVAEAVYSNVTVTVGGWGDEDPWLGFVQGDATITIVENVVTLTGVMSSWDGLTLDVTISGTLPVVEPEKPEPTYTDNNLNPYAFGLESKLSDDKSTLTMTYRLNNSKATDVDVVVKGGDEVIIIVNGTTNIGKNTVEISTEGFPGGVDITWSVIVKGTSVEVPTREEKIYSFYHPSGLDIDNNPENETFGMLLVNEGMQSVASKTEGYVSAGFGAGIFAFTPSFDLIPNGELPGYNGGIEFTNTRADGTGTAYAPRRIRISEDGRIFVTSLNTDGNYLWEVNPENMNEWTTIFKGTLNDQRELVDAEGNFVAAPNNGFDVKGSGENLQLAMYSVNLSGITAAAMSGFRLHEYNLGTATEWATAPSKALVEGKYAINYTGTQVEYDNEGGFWIASYRGSATDANPGLVHINAEGVEDCKLVWNNVRQAGIRFNNDFTKLVVAGNNGAAKKATIYAVSKDANGAPVLTEETVVDMAVVGNNLNDFAWDYAGNLYSCGNSSEKLAAWAMPYSGEVETPAAAKYTFQLEGTGSDYEMYEDVITNLVIDYDNLLLIGGPSEAFQVEVVLGLGDYDRNTDAYQLLPESSISVLGSEATFVEGYASVDGIEQSATAVVRCMWNGMALEFHLTMTAAPLEATVVVVENATVEIEKYLLWGDMYDYSLKMTGVWFNTEDGLEYPVTVEVPVYYPEATEPSEIMSTVTVGGWNDEDPWLGFGEGTLTVTTVDGVVTATGIVQNPMAGVAIDITISGKLPQDPGPGTGIEDVEVEVKAVKVIKNGQLIINRDGKMYNAQGAILK